MKVNTRKFSTLPSLSCDGLKQTSTRTIKYSNDEHFPTTVTVNFTLPPYVLPFYWKQYNLSLKDILQQSDDIPAKYYWLSALLYGIDTSASSVKASFACKDQVLISSKPIAIKKIIKAESIKLPTENKLINLNSHKPATPKILLSREDMHKISKLICTGIKPFEIPIIKGLFLYQDCFYLPFALEEDSVLLNRCVLQKNYIDSGKEKNFMSKPLLVKNEYDNEIYALVEDIVLASIAIH